MEKLSQRFYEQIKSRIGGEIEGYMPEDYQLDIYGARGRGTTTLDFEVELPEGYVADVTLRVYTDVYYDRGNYFTPPESRGTHSWEVTYLYIWNAEGELAEELNELGYMEGEYEW